MSGACSSRSLVAFACVLAAPTAAQFTDPLQLAQSIANEAQPAGEKDTADNFDVFRLGYALYYTGDASGGYSSLLAELALESQNLHPSPAYTYFESLLPYSSVYLQFATLPLSPELDMILYGIVYQSAYGQFSTSGAGNDLGRLLGTSGTNMVAAQNTITSVWREFLPTGDVMHSFDYPVWTGTIAPAVASAQFKIVQNIGFANNPGFPVGEYDFNTAHPLVTRYANPDQANLPFGPKLSHTQYALTALLDDVGGPGGALLDNFLHIPWNLAFPEVAQLVEESLEDRVNGVPSDSTVDYQVVGGEYFFHFDDASATGAVTSANYLNSLNAFDYSAPSLIEFRHWLARQYAGFAVLEQAWGLASGFFANLGCTAIESCTAIDPLAAPGWGSPDFQQIHDDWTAFQGDQTDSALTWQYNVAKDTRPAQSMYTISFGTKGVEFGAQRSDGVASADWYANAGQKLAIPSQMKRIAMHGATYGESVNFPLFGMPLSGGICWGSGGAQSWPDTYKPGCFDVDFSRRTLREFLALGVDSLGLGYFENVGNWNIVDGEFNTTTTATDPNMAVAMGAEVSALQDRRLFMTPWRSPLLIHTGSASESDDSTPTARAMRVFAEQQVQVAPFSRIEGLDDLWLSSQREVLVSAFVPELNRELFEAYQAAGLAHGWEVLVLTDLNTAAALYTEYNNGSGGNDLIVCNLGGTANVEITCDIGRQPSGACPSTPAVRLYVLYDTSYAYIEHALNTYAISELDSYCQRSFRPVRVKAFGGADVKTIDLSVACDGINLLVSAANISTTLPTTHYQIQLDLTPPASISSWDLGGAASFRLAPGQAELRYVRANVPALAGFTPTQMANGVSSGQSKVNALPSSCDKRAANALLGLMPNAGSLPKEKVLAGLMRLSRMPFVDLNATGATVLVRDLDGNVLPGAPTQVEHVLQGRVQSAIAATVGASALSVALCQPGNAKTWDFANQAYVLPSTNLVEVHAQHPSYGSQGVNAASAPVSVCP